MEDEVNRLNAEIERLLAENSMLRKEIEKLRGSKTEASGSGLSFTYESRIVQKSHSVLVARELFK